MVIFTWLFSIQLQKYEFICTFVVLGSEFIFAVELKNVLPIVLFYKPRFILNFILLKNIYLIVVIWKTGSKNERLFSAYDTKQLLFSSLHINL